MTRGTLEAANLCAEAELEAQRSIVTGSVGTLRLGIASGPRRGLRPYRRCLWQRFACGFRTRKVGRRPT
jgi:hypothetical protein